MHGASKTRAASSPALLSLFPHLFLSLLPHRSSAPEMLSSAFFLPLLAVLASAAPTPGGGEGRESPASLSRIRTRSGTLDIGSGLTLRAPCERGQPASTSSSRATTRSTNSRPRSRSRRSATGTSTPTSVGRLSLSGLQCFARSGTDSVRSSPPGNSQVQSQVPERGSRQGWSISPSLPFVCGCPC